MTPEELNERAKGRVWTGEDAHTQGLVDELGGLIRAVDVAKELANIEADKRVQLINMTPAASAGDALGQLFGASAETIRAVQALSQILGDEQISQALIQAQAMQKEPSQMTMPMIVEK
jgi:protease-4